MTDETTRRVGTVLDNRDGNNLQNIFHAYTDLKEIDVAVGYFYVGGFDVVKDRLRDGVKVRILIGDETDRITADQISLGYREKHDRDLIPDLNNLNDEECATLEELHDFIEAGAVHVKVYKKAKFHAKVYVFRRDGQDNDAAVVGSSNFSKHGLGVYENNDISGNVEMNTKHTDTETVEKIEKWFEQVWNEGEDYDEKILKIIENSAPYRGRKALDPEYASIREFFNTMVYEFHLDGEGEPSQTHDTLMDFQKIGVLNAKYKINKYGGCIIADSVGLGKTLIGLSLVHDRYKKQDSVLIIVPKHVQDNWRAEVYKQFPELEEPLKNGDVHIVTTNYLSNLDLTKNQDCKELCQIRDKYKFIVIDEAHRFRNDGKFENGEYDSGNKNYANLRYLHTPDTKYALLTATPLNNSIKDLENLVSIFTNYNVLKKNNTSLDFQSFAKCHKIMKKITETRKKLKDKKEHVSRSDLKKLQTDLQENMKPVAAILEEVMILRTRTAVAEKYPDMEIEGRRLLPTPPEIIAEKYDPGDKMTSMYGAITSLLKNLNVPHLTMAGGEQSGQNLSGLYKVLLFKRLESSVHSFVRSLENLKKNELTFLSNLGDGTEETRQHVVQTTFDPDGVEGDELSDYVLDLGVDDVMNVTRDQVESQVMDDVELIQQFMSQHIEAIRNGEGTYEDPKLEKLKEIIRNNDGKLLVFSQYADTVEYLENNLGDMMEQHGIKADYVVGGMQEVGSREKPRRKAELFAPHANLVTVEPEQEIDVLVTTDTLSEGINLQDCSVVVNYDLPWNPTRLIQRVGRVDRIGSTKRTTVHNILPDESLDVLLNLLEQLSTKIRTVAEIIGKEHNILSGDEVIEVKTIGQKISKIREAETWGVYEDEGRNPILKSIKSKNEKGEIMLLLQQVMLKHNMQLTRPHKRNPYTIVRTGQRSRTFVMFKVFDGANHQKMSDFIVRKNRKSDECEIIEMDDCDILDLPQNQTSIHRNEASRLGFNLDQEVEQIRRYFEQSKFTKIQESYKQSAFAATNREPILEFIVSRLRGIQKTLDSKDLKDEAQNVLTLLTRQRIMTETINIMTKTYQKDGNDWKHTIAKMDPPNLVSSLREFYDREIKDKSQYPNLPTKIRYEIVCRGAIL